MLVQGGDIEKKCLDLLAGVGLLVYDLPYRLGTWGTKQGAEWLFRAN